MGLKTAEIACQIFPAGWRTCLEKADIEFNSGDFYAAMITTEKILQRHKNNYFAAELYIQSLFHLNKEDKACEELDRLDYFFGRTGQTHERFLDYCAN